MTTTQRHRSQPPVPEPEYDNLEIRCTWSGEYEEVSNIRISLEVKCVPNTQLQLLSLRSPGIFFEESFLERLPQTEDDTGGLDGTNTPQSPLFGFSPLVRDANRDTGLFFDGCSSFIPETSPTVEEKEQALVASESIKNGSEARNAEVVLGNPVPSTPTTRCRSDSVVSEAESFTRSRKRSASDAELPDSGSDVDDTHGVLKDISNHKMRQMSRFTPASPGDRTTESLSSERLDPSHKQRESPRSPKKLSARKSGPTKTPGLTIPNENASPRNMSRSTVTETWLTDKLVSPGKSTRKGKQPQKSSLIPKPASTGNSESLQLTSFATTAVGFHLTSRGALEDHAPATVTPKAQSVKETRVRFQIPNDGPTVTERSEGQLSSTATSRELGAAFERTSLTSSGKTRLCYVPGNFGDSCRLRERTDVEQPEPSDQPEVEAINGLLILRNSERVLPATFKVTIIAARSIYYPSEQGWSDLEIPGIPRTKSGKIGVLLFLMPAHHGLEIRTTDVNRATIVEDCLVAEFVSTGNLVIPLRRCSREFCGEIGGFTVDQEIISQNIVGAAATPGQSDQPVIQMRCHAACSVRLYNRCFWSKRCIISLCVDGGPSGFFYCDLTSQQRVTKSICITARGTKIGVSHIRVVCSPKDIDRLYLRWTIEFPGRRAAYWIPRIYPALSTSHELSQHSLRYKLLEVMNDPSYLYSRIDATEVNCDSSEIAQRYRDYEQAPDDVSEDAGSILSQPVAASSASRSRTTAEMQDGLNPSHFLKRVLVGVLCLAVLRFTYVKLPDRSFRTHPSSMRHVEVLQQTEQLPSFHSLETQFKDHQEWLGNLDSNPDLNSLDEDRHAAILVDGEEGKTSVNDGEQDVQSVEMEVKVEERGKPSVSLRDRVDYWLGWTGPV
ncbi:hypothetical protein BDW60DRAFT_223450 [Aspergillus nidulans var. acristatus]